ncbi:response regulator transcription factor [Microbacterium terricola]|uniref:DNA-binding response regulator n=1 Tax=Microbacterium terricola TaxID=344163 RepID=A0ABM8E1H7_9MICO|nr:response regulator transcription factor [Microbacterium terricola]UYK40657.1 response regulator transcription factor [Microbacterium terricola]BDV31610.1 DNA-binding response regulator [Microbacterium terricola]
MRVLLVEDDALLAATVAQLLREAGYAVDVEADAASALVTFEIEPEDLVVLDVRLPGMPGGGVELCRRIREVAPDTPILMLTAISARATIVQCLDAGADDYLVKPFHVQELLARIRALLRRAPTALPPRLTVGSLTLDPGRRAVERRGRVIPLSPKEFSVLDYLMRHPDAVITSSELIDHAWDRNYDGYSNVVPTYIRYLRRKLAIPGEADPIVTHRGAGYSVTSEIA